MFGRPRVEAPRTKAYYGRSRTPLVNRKLPPQIPKPPKRQNKKVLLFLVEEEMLDGSIFAEVMKLKLRNKLQEEEDTGYLVSPTHIYLYVYEEGKERRTK
jgi:hypothetical protein